MLDAIIVGGGIAGLHCAHRISRSGRSVLVLERGARPGGSILSERRDAYLLEMGPNTIQRSTPELERLIDELNLARDVVEAAAAAKRRYIVRGGRPIAVPTSPGSMLATDLLSWKARLNIIAEPFRSKGTSAGDETVSSFVRRRLGDEFLSYTIDPFVSGVYAGDAERLSIRHAFPKVHRLEEESGSLIRGSIKAMRRRAGAAKPRWKMFNFTGGLSHLVTALTEELGDDVQLGKRVTALHRSDLGWTVVTKHESFQAQNLILALPLHALTQLESAVAAALPAAGRVTYPPLAVVHLAYDAGAIEHPLDGFGMLVPSKEDDIDILGSLFTSSLFPDRAPDGIALLTAFIGGRRRPDLVMLPNSEILGRVHRDLALLLGIRGEPIFTSVYRWDRAIPQYEVGYGAVKDQIRKAEQNFPGLFFAGNYVSGISVTDTVRSAEEASSRLLASVAGRLR